MRRCAVLALMIVTSPGCPGFKGEDTGEWGQGDEDEGGSDPADDSGADPDTDTDDPGVDGPWSGEALLNVTLIGQAMACEGAVDFVVTDGALEGSLECSFAEGDEMAAALGLTDTYVAAMTGDVRPDGDAVGQLAVEIIAEATADWTGEVGSSGALEATVTGEIPMTGFEPAQLDGTFTARRD